MQQTHYEALMEGWGATDAEWQAGLDMASNIDMKFSQTMQDVDSKQFSSAMDIINTLKNKGISKKLCEMIVTVIGLKRHNFSLWDTVISQDLEKARLTDTRDSLRKVLNLAYHLYMHQRNGKRAYDVSGRLGQQLKNTELRGLYSEDIRLPYPNIYICVPSELDFKVLLDSAVLSNPMSTLPQPEMVPINGIFATEDTDKDGVRHLHCLFVSNEHWNGFYWFTLSLDANTPVDDCIANSLRYMENTAKRYPGSIDRVMASLWPAIFKWVLNVVMYATCSNPGEHVVGNKEARQLWERIRKLPKGSKKRGDLLDRAKRTPRQDRIMLDSIVVDRARDNEGQGSGTGSPMTVRTLVSGHWRKQPHGKARALRKHIWIEPFWRGPEMGPVVARRHVLKSGSL